MTKFRGSQRFSRNLSPNKPTAEFSIGCERREREYDAA
jgi:hypothetical protein